MRSLNSDHPERRRRLTFFILGSVGVVGIALGGPVDGRRAACFARASLTSGLNVPSPSRRLALWYGMPFMVRLHRTRGVLACVLFLCVLSPAVRAGTSAYRQRCGIHNYTDFTRADRSTFRNRQV